jgi:hypothetical protein
MCLKKNLVPAPAYPEMVPAKAISSIVKPPAAIIAGEQVERRPPQRLMHGTICCAAKNARDSGIALIHTIN